MLFGGIHKIKAMQRLKKFTTKKKKSIKYLDTHKQKSSILKLLLPKVLNDSYKICIVAIIVARCRNMGWSD